VTWLGGNVIITVIFCQADRRLHVVSSSKAQRLAAVLIKQTAAACGFGNEDRLRRAFARQVETTPADYRRRF